MKQSDRTMNRASQEEVFQAQASPPTQDVFQILLGKLLDLRFRKANFDRFKDNAFESASYRLVNELLFCLPHRCVDEVLEKAVQARLDKMATENPTGVEELLERAQLYGWMAYRRKVQYQTSSDEDSPWVPEGLNFLEQCIKTLIYISRHHRLRLLQKRGLTRQIQFLIQAIRFEMKEVSSPQNGLEAMLKEDAKLELMQKRCGDLLQRDQLAQALGLARQLQAKRPYSLRLECLHALVALIHRLRSTFKSLHHPSRYQWASYRRYLLDRADRNLKRFCWLLRTSARYPKFPLEILEKLGDIASNHWFDLEQIYKEEMERTRPSQELYWRWWIQAQILSLGARLGGAHLQEHTLSTQDHGALALVRQMIDSQLSSTPHSSVLKLLVSLIALLQEAFDERRELERSSLESLSRQLKQIQEASQSVEQQAILERHRMDLHLLYHRDPRVGAFEVLRLVAPLLGLYPSTSHEELFARSLRLLEEFYDLWSGSSFRSPERPEIFTS